MITHDAGDNGGWHLNREHRGPQSTSAVVLDALVDALCEAPPTCECAEFQLKSSSLFLRKVFF